ncbi:FecR family protein [uncultured Alistipes sp.]|jgi:hypothetical protein|uniref:FecR family protein n=1 Tax=uncultured Alistipes sp. TaxID=538949 RepID=UPI0025F0D8CA|nr:FecR family protein [uncultured Alistipes sp.]
MNDYINLLEKFFCGATSAEEEHALTEWLRDKSESDPEIAAYYRSKWAETNGSIDKELKARIHARIRETIDSDSNFESARPRRILPGRIVPWIAAACIAVVAFVGWYNYARVSASRNDLFEVYTEKGQKTNITLPDGTRVWLNSDSKLSYNGGYNLRKRSVNLVGEGYFEVAKNPERPFSVNTANYNVVALGTTFNIKSYPADAISVTTLFEGCVRIDGGHSFSMMLDPMEAIVYNATEDSFTKNGSDRAHFAGLWRNNELIVESGTTLEKLAEILDREYNIRFTFRSERIKRLCFEGIIKNNNLHNVLQLICLSGEVCFTIEDNTVVFDQKR